MDERRPVFIGNFEYNTIARDVEKLFEKYGRVKKMDMKQGEVRRRERERRESTKNNPSNTLFVVNFEPSTTRERDLEKHFSPYGNVVRYDMQRNFCFIQFETVEEASRALEATNESFLGDQQITVEFTYKQRSVTDRDGRRKRDFSPDRDSRGRRDDDGSRRRRRDDRRDSPDDRNRDYGSHRSRRRSPDYRDRDNRHHDREDRDRDRDRDRDYEGSRDRDRDRDRDYNRRDDRERR